MQANRSTNTKPELLVRSMLHRAGYRFRIHDRSLPGKPDIVFAARRKIIEIRGCFWHGHGCSPIGLLPKTRPEYWQPKIAATRLRDARNEATLAELGWTVLNLWECEVRDGGNTLAARIFEFLGPPRHESYNG